MLLLNRLAISAHIEFVHNYYTSIIIRDEVLNSSAISSLLRMLCMLKLVLVQSVLHIRTTLFLSNGTEDQIHVLQGPALGFFHEESDKDSIGSAEDAEHDEGLPANAVDGTRSNFSNDEVEQPLSGSSETDTV